MRQRDTSVLRFKGTLLPSVPLGEDGGMTIETTTTSMAIIAIVASLALLGVVAVTIVTVPLQLQQAEAAGCHGPGFNASQGRCFGHGPP